MDPWLAGSLAILVALIPCLPLRLVSNESLARARDMWLLLMLAVGTVWAAVYIPPFAPIGIFFLWHWRSRAQLPSLMTWCVIGIFFFGVGRLPDVVWTWIPVAWLASGAAGVVVLAKQWWDLRPPGSAWWNPYRPFHAAAWWGQRTVGACFFALLLPFAPWWALPVPLLGLLITSSWTAWLAGLAALCVLYPLVLTGVLWVGGILLVLAGLQEGSRWVKRTRWNVLSVVSSGGRIYRKNQADMSASAVAVGPELRVVPRPSAQPRPGDPAVVTKIDLWSLLNWRRWLEYTPRGDSLDSLWQRVTVNRLLLYAWTNPAWWPFGHGPRSMEKQVMRWASKIGPDKIPLGQVHADGLHFIYEFGLPGIAALMLLAAKVIPRLQCGDPWSACIVAGVILSTASIPFRPVSVALIWLTAAAHVAAR